MGTLLLIMAIWLMGLMMPHSVSAQTEPHESWWKVQSIDTMKYSRDPSRAKLKDPSFDQVIEDQVSRIAKTGATHVAIGTPYDEEFIPIMKRWVSAARRHNLSVWFRGNFSGWEGWFEYPEITRDQHIEMTKQFILNNKELFKDGDIFTSCPECENGGPGDPRMTGDAAGHKAFLIREHLVATEAFIQIKRQVNAGYYSMNGDVARLIMDKETTHALGGVVAVDHYVDTPEKLVADIKEYIAQSGGKVVLGEFGMPIPDIHGKASEEQQAKWIESALEQLSWIPEVEGVNYWTSFGGSTLLWNDNGSARQAVDVVSRYFGSSQYTGQVVNVLQRPVPNVSVKYHGREFQADTRGIFTIPLLPGQLKYEVTAPDYNPTQVQAVPGASRVQITLQKSRENLIFKVQKLIHSIIRAIIP